MPRLLCFCDAFQPRSSSCQNVRVCTSLFGTFFLLFTDSAFWRLVMKRQLLLSKVMIRAQAASCSPCISGAGGEASRTSNPFQPHASKGKSLREIRKVTRCSEISITPLYVHAPILISLQFARWFFFSLVKSKSLLTRLNILDGASPRMCDTLN